ncbi:MAG: aminotransferase class V-fold PLP-dependent enzyme [Bacillota bacterium]
MGLASNVIGTINDVRTIADAAHSVGAYVVVDAVHAAPHMFIDRDALGSRCNLVLALQGFWSSPRESSRSKPTYTTGFRPIRYSRSLRNVLTKSRRAL